MISRVQHNIFLVNDSINVPLPTSHLDIFVFVIAHCNQLYMLLLFDFKSTNWADFTWLCLHLCDFSLKEISHTTLIGRLTLCS